MSNRKNRRKKARAAFFRRMDLDNRRLKAQESGLDSADIGQQDAASFSEGGDTGAVASDVPPLPSQDVGSYNNGSDEQAAGPEPDAADVVVVAPAVDITVGVSEPTMEATVGEFVSPAENIVYNSALVDDVPAYEHETEAVSEGDVLTTSLTPSSFDQDAASEDNNSCDQPVAELKPDIPAKIEAKKTPFKAEVKQPVKVEARQQPKQAPVKVEAKKTPVKVEVKQQPKQAPVKAEVKKTPVKAEAKQQPKQAPVKAEAKKTPVKAEVKQQPVTVEAKVADKSESRDFVPVVAPVADPVPEVAALSAGRQESVPEPALKQAAALLPTLAALSVLIGPAELFLAKEVGRGMVRVFWEVGRALRDGVEAVKRTRDGQLEMAGLAGGLMSAYGRRFTRAKLYLMAKFAARVPEEAVLEDWLASFSWSQIQQLIRLPDPSRLEEVASRVREEGISARGLRRLVSREMGVPVNYPAASGAAKFFRDLGRMHLDLSGRSTEGDGVLPGVPGAPGFSSEGMEPARAGLMLLDMLLGPAARHLTAPASETPGDAGPDNMDGVSDGAGGGATTAPAVSPLRALSLGMLRLHLMDRCHFGPCGPGVSSPPAGVDLLLRRSDWGRQVAMAVVDGAYDEAVLGDMCESLGSLDPGAGVPGDKDPVGIVVFLGGPRPRAELVCPHVLDLTKNLAACDADDFTFAGLGQQEEFAELVGRFYRQSWEGLRRLLEHSAPRTAGQRNGRPDSPASDSVKDGPDGLLANDAPKKDAEQPGTIGGPARGVSDGLLATDEPQVLSVEDEPEPEVLFAKDEPEPEVLPAKDEPEVLSVEPEAEVLSVEDEPEALSAKDEPEAGGESPAGADDKVKDESEATGNSGGKADGPMNIPRAVAKLEKMEAAENRKDARAARRAKKRRARRARRNS
ncbi:MAG: DUF1016 N-terminal domain-containing protein [Deltaproteobacteria bacterium]|jgi:hypothetical protein|nr:DUF1016 N-terminal domain-containing protein [Deltaproteobacteria bacterium]